MSQEQTPRQASPPPQASPRLVWRPLFWLGLLALLALLLAALGPAERTLGNGIRVVYVHVALTWAGLAGFGAAGVVAVASLWPGQTHLEWWRRALGWAALGFYLAGMGVSVLASQVNWGAVFWQEPRMVTSMNVLAAALLVQLADHFFPWRWLRVGLSALLPVFIVWANLGTRLVLHPGNAVSTSSSPAIRLTFLGMFALCLLALGVAVWWAGRRRGPAQAPEAGD